MYDPIVEEFADVDLGDQRLNRRAPLFAEAWNAAPTATFPSVARTAAEFEGNYGFLENPRVDPHEIHAAHARATRRRIDAAHSGRTVLVVHDTTSCSFSGDVHRDGMGWIARNQQGFHAHISLALSSDGTRCPLGVIGVAIAMPPRPAPTVKGEKKKKARRTKAVPLDAENESLRWSKAIRDSNVLLRGHAIPIHVMDREAESYELIAEMQREGSRYVARVRVLDRNVMTAADGFEKHEKLSAVLERSVPVVARDVELNRRRKSKFPDANKKHPPRLERTAKLEFVVERVRWKRPPYLDEKVAATIDVSVVEVREIATPEGMEPVHWMLVTSEPIDSAEDALFIVDTYRARWTIEELNKAIKTGCDFEKRQLESAHALLIAFAMCMPIAWQMLVLRHQSRHNPEAPADTVLSNERLEVLTAIARSPVPAKPTARDVLYAIAALGGHIKKNGPPGWITLRRGLDDLIVAERAWAAARARFRDEKVVANE